MLAAPSLHAVAALLLTAVTFWALARGRLRIELICLVLIAVLALGFYFFPFQGQDHYTGMEIAFGGFGHEALVAICCLMILGRGLAVTGALEPAARLLGRVWRFNTHMGMLFTLIVCGALSMFVNDTPVLVLALPILLNLATRVDLPASKTLMPVNSAILIGGMSTTIGTSTNLLVVSIAQDLGVPRFGLFQFTGVALSAAVIALPYVWLIMPRLLPSTSSETAESRRIFDATLHIVATSALVGTPIKKLAQRIGHGVKATGLVRGGRAIGLNTNGEVEIGDMALVAATSAQLRDASKDLKAPLLHPAIAATLQAFGEQTDEDSVTAELVLGTQSTLIGETVKSSQLADRYGVAVIGAYRPEHAIFGGGHHPIIERLEVGDVLLIEGAPSRVRELEIGEAAMVLEGATEMPRTQKAGLALIIVAAVIAIAALRIVPIAIAALAGTIAMLATGCIKFERIGRALSAEVIVLVAASIALGRALVETGAANWLGSVFAFSLQALPPAVVLAAVMAFTTLLTNFISNAAAAAVGTPVAVSLAGQLGIAPEPLIAAVLFGANLCFVTPMAYQTNLMIMTAGGYRFRDYVRAGLPLAVLLIVCLAVLLVRKYAL